MVTKKKAKKSSRPKTKWQLHLNKIWKEMKAKNKNAKFSDAMKLAKKSYVPIKKK